MNMKHNGTVSTDMFVENAYTAECSCGWMVDTYSEEKALAALQEHYEGVIDRQ